MMNDLSGSFSTLAGDFHPGDSALVQIKWKATDNAKHYNEITTRGLIKLKRSRDEPPVFCLKIKPEDGRDVMEVPLPPGVDWNVTSTTARKDYVVAHVLQMSFVSPECNHSKIRIRIGLPLNSPRCERKAKRFADTLIQSNQDNMSPPPPIAKRPLLFRNTNSNKQMEIIQSNPFLRRVTMFANLQVQSQRQMQHKRWVW